MTVSLRTKVRAALDDVPPLTKGRLGPLPDVAEHVVGADARTYKAPHRGPADKAVPPLRPGDVVVSLDGKAVKTPADFERLAKERIKMTGESFLLPNYGLEVQHTSHQSRRQPTMFRFFLYKITWLGISRLVNWSHDQPRFQDITSWVVLY